MAQFSINPVSAILGTSAALIHTVPAGTEQTLTGSLANFTTADVTVSLWVVEPGGTRANQHTRLPDYVVTAKEPRKMIERESFPPGTMFYAGASAANSVSMQFTGTSRGV